MLYSILFPLQKKKKTKKILRCMQSMSIPLKKVNLCMTSDPYGWVDAEDYSPKLILHLPDNVSVHGALGICPSGLQNILARTYFTWQKQNGPVFIFVLVQLLKWFIIDHTHSFTANIQPGDTTWSVTIMITPCLIWNQATSAILDIKYRVIITVTSHKILAAWTYLR